MLLFLSVALISATILTFTSCGKYEDGPSFSLSSKKGRVINTWKIEKHFDIPTGQDHSSNDESIEFKKDGTYIWTEGTYSFTGTWNFASHKEDIVLTYDGYSDVDVCPILRLTKKEFWFQIPALEEEYHLSQK